MPKHLPKPKENQHFPFKVLSSKLLSSQLQTPIFPAVSEERTNLAAF